MSKQQTAVEWLHLQLKEWAKLNSGFDTLFEQAKEMEKEQITKSYSDGLGNGIAVGQEECSFQSVADEQKYYEQTYGGNK